MVYINYDGMEFVVEDFLHELLEQSKKFDTIKLAQLHGQIEDADRQITSIREKKHISDDFDVFFKETLNKWKQSPRRILNIVHEYTAERLDELTEREEEGYQK